MASNKREKRVEADIKKYLRSFGSHIYYYKNHGSMMTDPGRPDIVCCVSGRFVGIEVKRESGGVQSEAQIYHQKLIENAGGVYILADSLDDVKRIIF